MDIYKHFAFHKKEKEISQKSLTFHAGKVIKARNDIFHKGQKLREQVIANPLFTAIARGCNM